MPDVREWFAGEPILAQKLGAPMVRRESEFFRTCQGCGQYVDERDLAQVSWHEQPDHGQLPHEIVYRVSNATGMLEDAIGTRARFEKQRSTDGLWKVIERSTGRVVLVDGLPLYDLDAHEADEAVELLEQRQ